MNALDLAMLLLVLLKRTSRDHGKAVWINIGIKGTMAVEVQSRSCEPFHSGIVR